MAAVPAFHAGSRPNTVPVDFTAAMQTVNGHPVPEPATLLLFGSGAALLAGARRRLKT